MRFRIDIDDRAAEKALKELLRRGENLEPALRSVGGQGGRARELPATGVPARSGPAAAPREVSNAVRTAGYVLTGSSDSAAPSGSINACNALSAK